jgi:hypothetical protein
LLIPAFGGTVENGPRQSPCCDVATVVGVDPSARVAANTKKATP